MRRHLLTVAVLLTALAPWAGARGAIIVNNWVIDLDGAFGTAAGTFGKMTGVDQIGITGLFHQHLFAAPAVGVDIAVDGVARATGMIGSPSDTTSDAGAVLNGPVGIPALKPWELTASFSVIATINDVDPGADVTFMHQAAGYGPYDGLLDIYLDDLAGVSPSGADTGAKSDVDPTTGGAGFADGRKIATFAVMFGDEGIINLTSLDGNDSARFELISAVSGVLFDDMGNDLADLVGPTEILLAISSTTLDLDGQPLADDGLPNNPMPAGWPAADAGGFTFRASGSFGDSYGQEDGSFELAVEDTTIPEPMSFLVWGGLATVVGGVSMWRMRKS